MAKKIVKKGLIVLMIFVVIIIAINAISVTVTGRCTKYVNDYNEFYIYKKEKNVVGLFGFAMGSGYKIWIKPLQKKKLLNKIKEDVNLELTNAVASNSDKIKNYDISDDFKKITLYYYKDAKNYGVVPDDPVKYKIELYHQIVSGPNVELSKILNYVEVE